MPGKSTRRQSKKSRAKQRFNAAPAPQRLASGSTQPAMSVAAAPSSKAATQTAGTRVSQYPYVGMELITISILAGIILMILIVLALILR